MSQFALRDPVDARVQNRLEPKWLRIEVHYGPIFSYGPDGPANVWVWILLLGFQILDSGFWILGSGFWILESGFWILDSRFWILDSGF